jgi:DNA polymerase III epsilon subunit family exonuclease
MIDHFAAWIDVPLAVIDLETTGMSPSRDDRIVEIAVVRIERMQVVRTWQTYLNPDRPIPEDASRVHGIYDEDVALAPRFRDKADEFLAACAGAVPCAYNEGFDRSFVMAELWHAGKHNTELLSWPAWLDVLAWVRSTDRFVKSGDGSKISNALGAACARRGIETPGAHGAKADATAAALLLEAISSDMPRSTISELIRRQKLLSAAHDRRGQAAKAAGRVL